MIGAIVTLEEDGHPENGDALSFAPEANLGSKLVTWDVLGENVLNRFLRKVETISAKSVVFLSDASGTTVGNSAGYSRYAADDESFSSWEEAAQALLAQGAQTLLLVKLTNYLEVDLVDLAQFHHATSSKLTQVFIENQPVSMVLVQASELRTKGISLRRQLANIIPLRRRYQYKEYFNPLADLDDFRQLYTGAFSGECDITPVGDEIAPGVWAGEDVSINPLVTITGPAYFGARTVIHAGSVIAGPAILEQDCEVDCGTTLEDCALTRNTYVGPGLNLKNALAGPGWLYNLDRQTALTINDSKLLGSTYSNNLLNRAKSLLSSPAQWRAGSTFFSQTASLHLPSRVVLDKHLKAESHFKVARALSQEDNRENPSR
jgi:hypothetical protein